MTFASGSSTPFGIFDGDAAFRLDADKVLEYVARRLGDSHVQVELSSSDVYAAFEESAMEYSSLVNAYQAKSVMSSFLGTSTGSMTGAENTYPQNSLEWARRQAESYSELAGLNSHAALHKTSITLTSGQQDYDLQLLISPTGSDGLPRRMIISEIYHYAPLTAQRMFGTTSFLNYLDSQFKFESYTPETVFYLLPIWEDILRGMQFETSNRVRRSNYSYALHNNVLTLYPQPTTGGTLWLTYRIAEATPLGGSGTSADPSVHGVANVSNIPFGNIEYSKLNSLSKRWIWQMTLAISKETMGYIRRKINSIPVPGGDSVTLDGADLVSDARSEMERLRSDLKELLEDMTYDKLAERESQKTQSLLDAMKQVPLKIFVG
jgi:hypothetical protein